jgi:hypothetical protein
VLELLKVENLQTVKKSHFCLYKAIFLLKDRDIKDADQNERLLIKVSKNNKLMS